MTSTGKVETRRRQERGLWNNTLLLMTSDNGGPAALTTSGGNANNFPLRGGKKTGKECMGRETPLSLLSCVLNCHVENDDLPRDRLATQRSIMRETLKNGRFLMLSHQRV